MSDQNMQDPAAQYLVGGQPQQQETFEAFGQQFESKQAFEAAFANKIREYETQLAELKRQPVPQQAPAAPAQGQRLTQEQYYQKFAQEGLTAANDAWLKEKFFGDANAPYDPGQALREATAAAVSAQRMAQQLSLKIEHPEVNWSDDKLVQTINEEMRNSNSSYKGAIAILQTQGKIPTRWQYEQERARQFQQAYGLQPQQQPYGGQPQQQGNVVSMPAAPPPTVPRGGAPPQAKYDLAAISARLNEIAGKSVRERTPAEETEFNRLADLYAQESQQARVG